jgi:DNA-binding CsgD family transcriptional regulator
MNARSRDFIGRRAELRMLDDALTQCARGQIRFVLVKADAGMGKTTLVRMFSDRARRTGVHVLLAECAREDASRPFGPLLNLPAGPLAAVAERALKPAATASERDQMFAAIAERLREMASTRPVVMILEDAHWSDEDTLRLLPYLGRRAADSALLVMLTFRDSAERSAALTRTIVELRRRDGIEIELPPLTSSQTVLLARSVLAASGRVDSELRSYIVDHSGGNPLFVEELTRGLVQRGWIVCTDEVWHPARSLADATVPTSVAASVRASLALMARETRTILASAAVIGERFTFDVLLGVTLVWRDALVAALRAGIDAELIEERPVDGPTYAFRHALFRDALLDGLIGPERQDLHRRVAVLLETNVTPADRQSLSEELAHHFDAAGEADAAVRYHLEAARVRGMARQSWPTGFSANANVASHLERALALAPTDHPRRAEMLRVYAWAQDDRDRRLSLIEQSRAQAQAAGDQRGVALSTVMAGVWISMRGDRSGLARIREGISMLEALGPTIDLAEASFQLARLAMLDGDADAVALSERAVELARTHDEPELLANALVTLGPAQVAAGDINGIEATRAGIAVARDHRTTAVLPRALINLVNCVADSGGSDYEIAEADHAYSLAVPLSGDHLGRAFLEGRWDEALEMADELLAFEGTDPGTELVRAYIDVARRGPAGFVDDIVRAHAEIEGMLLWRGTSLATEALYLCGDYRAALDAARYVARSMERGVRLAENQGAAVTALAAAVALDDPPAIDEWLERCASQRPLEPQTAEARRAYARGERALRMGDTDQALDAFTESAAGFNRPVQSLLARTLPRLRRVDLLARNDPDAAQRELATVMSMWRAVDANWYLGHLREWSRELGLRGWTGGVRRGPRPTRRELEVARLVALGLTNKEIGVQLRIAERTAETHVQRIVTKLDLRSRSQLAAWMAGGRGTTKLHS